MLKPASEGTGVIASGAVRAVCDGAGISNILTKCHRSNNPINVVKATFDGLSRLKAVRVPYHCRRIIKKQGIIQCKSINYEALKAPANVKRSSDAGRGTGHGKRSGRGQTGQNCRSGRGVMLAYEGGQMSLLRRLPKVGFNSKWPAKYQVVNCESLNRFEDGTTITPELLKSHQFDQVFAATDKNFKRGRSDQEIDGAGASFFQGGC